MRSYTQPVSKLYLAVLSVVFLLASLPQVARAGIAEDQSGKILLQVERNGEAWYIYPVNKLRYYLGRPHDAFAIMRESGLGISNTDLKKIPRANTNDGEGDLTLRQRLTGRIVIQVERNGEAWYIYPDDLKRYFLGRPSDAFAIMHTLGLGADNENINQIPPDRTFQPNLLHVTEGGYSFTFDGLIGRGDAGSWKFVPWGTDSQPFEYSLFSRSLPCQGSLYWCGSGPGSGGNNIYIGRLGDFGGLMPWLTTRSSATLATRNWNSFVNVYMDDWLHRKNSDGDEIYSGDFKDNFKVIGIKSFTVQNYAASLVTMRESWYPQFYIRNKFVLLTKDYVNVYYLNYQTWTTFAETDTVLDKNFAEFERMAKTFKIL